MNCFVYRSRDRVKFQSSEEIRRACPFSSVYLLHFDWKVVVGYRNACLFLGSPFFSICFFYANDLIHIYSVCGSIIHLEIRYYTSSFVFVCLDQGYLDYLRSFLFPLWILGYFSSSAKKGHWYFDRGYWICRSLCVVWPF